MRFSFLFLIILGTAVVCAADFDFNAEREQFERKSIVGGGFHFTRENGDMFTGISADGDFRFTSFGFGFSIPILFTIYDNAANCDCIGVYPLETKGGIPIRDWDNVRDYIALLTYAQYGYKTSTYYARIGELANYWLGHGTLVNGYYNTLLFNHPKRAVTAHAQVPWGSFEVFTDDVSPPELFGGRAAIKPFSFMDRKSYWNNIEVGFSWAVDFFSPDSDAKNDDNHKPDTEFAGAVGADIDFRLLSLRYWQLTAYTDINKLLFAGTGIHLGIKQRFFLKDDPALELLSQIEFIASESNYIPRYFDAFYDYERPAFTLEQTKRDYLRKAALTGKGWKAGYYADIVFHWVDRFAVGASLGYYSLRDIADSSEQSHYDVNLFTDAVLGPVSITLHFNKTNAADSAFFNFQLNDTMLFGKITYTITDWIAVSANVSKKWRLDGDYWDYGSTVDCGFSVEAGYPF